MPRIRSTKPEFWADYDTARLPRDARLLYIGLWNFADEHARLAGDPRYVKGQVFPYDDDLGPAGIDHLLDVLAAAGKVVRYEADGAPYLHLPSLAKHQRLEPGKATSRIPPPPDPDKPPHSRADKSAPRADLSAQTCDTLPVENPDQASDPASPQVRAPQQVRADKSARGADESSPLYVAGSMEHGAAAAATRKPSPAPVGADRHAPPLPPQLEILKSKLDARKLHVRWDRLNPEQTTEIIDLIDLHGDGPLVASAVQSFRPDSPASFAQAWLAGWQALPTPGSPLRLLDDPPCDQPGHQGTQRRCTECITEAKAADR